MPVRLRRRRLAALALATLLAAPAPALGQSAGDEQYEDPFAGEQQQQQPELPRTGLDAGPLLALGAVLLAGGIVLRLRLRERA